MRNRSLSTARTAGFTLLELLAAIAIFGIMAVSVIDHIDVVTTRALDSVRSRELRVLADFRLGHVTIFEREFDDIFVGQDFDDLDEDQWENWEWDLDIRDVVVFGTSSDEQAEYLFGEPEEADEINNPDQPGQPAANTGETQFLRELTLTVRGPDIEGESDSVTIVTFLPLVDHGASGPPGQQNPGGN